MKRSSCKVLRLNANGQFLWKMCLDSGYLKADHNTIKNFESKQQHHYNDSEKTMNELNLYELKLQTVFDRQL